MADGASSDGGAWGRSARREIARRYAWDAHAGRILSLLAAQQAARRPADMGTGAPPFLPVR